MHKIAVIGLQWLLFRNGYAAGNQCHVGAFLRVFHSIRLMRSSRMEFLRPTGHLWTATSGARRL
jgi:hypothetical protein